jgi:amino acid permease
MSSTLADSFFSTALFVQMGSTLPKGGPAGLFLGFIIWSVVMLAMNECFGMCINITQGIYRKQKKFQATDIKYSRDGMLHANTVAIHPLWQRMGR